jgi:sec-independent protein translocase protein TatA
MFGRISGLEIIIILVILVVFFGASKLPDLARSLGESAKEFRKSIAKDDEEEPPGDTREP